MATFVDKAIQTDSFYIVHFVDIGQGQKFKTRPIARTTDAEIKGAGAPKATPIEEGAGAQTGLGQKFKTWQIARTTDAKIKAAGAPKATPIEEGAGGQTGLGQKFKTWQIARTTDAKMKGAGAPEATPMEEGAGAQTAHPSCIVGKNTGKEKPHSNQWVCHGCKLCAFCFETSENEAMAVCVECGDAYHLTCHNPPVTDEQWRNNWLCSSCDDIDKADTKPTDLQQVDIKQIEVNPVDIKPVDTNVVDVKPADIESDDLNPVDVMPDDVKPVDVVPADIKPVVTQAAIKPVDVKQADVKPSASKVSPFIYDRPLPPLSLKSQRLIEKDEFFRRYVPKEKTPDPTNWTVDEVCKYLQDHGCAAQAEAFRHHEIDGRSLLLLTRQDVLYELGIKLGPALKVNHFVQLLQKKDIRRVFPFNEMLY